MENRSEIIELIFDNMPFSYIFWKNKEGVYLGANANQIKLFGQSGKEFIGKTIFQILGDYHSAKLINDIDNRIMQEGKAVILEEPVITPQGEHRVFLSQKQPIRNNKGEIIGLFGFSLDITERKLIENELKFAKDLAEAANKAKTEFLENMRHDIRTPLTGIVGFADIIKMECEKPQIKEYADNLVASSYALLELLDEVLEAIRVSSGEIPKLKKKFNFQKALNHIIDLNRAKAAEKKLILTLDFDSNIPTFVIGDKVRIHRIALELVANALNFTDIGYVKLFVFLAKRNQRELIIKLVVEDSGIGIPKEKQQEIYIQFKRLTPSYQGIYKGVGLGLSVVKQFVDELNGEIYVESELKKGSRFTCIIPLQEPLLDDEFRIEEEMEDIVDRPYVKTYADEIRPKESLQTQRRVLVVEDNVVAQMVAKSILVQLNCQVDMADCGKKAIDLWRRNNYDLIFMDIGLPDIDGYEVTRQIRIQELTKKSHIPIIALTAHVGDENKKRCIEAGMNAVLTKPLTAQKCADIVDSFIPGHQKRESFSMKDYAGDLPAQESLFDLSAFPLFDADEAIRTMGSKEVLCEMLELLLNQSMDEDLSQMKTAYENNDWDKTQQIAHKIKGGAVYVGAVRMKVACQYLERYWKTGQRDLLEQLYLQALHVINESMVEARAWFVANKS